MILHLGVKPGQQIYLIFAAKKLKDKETIVFRGTVDSVVVESAPNNKIAVIYSVTLTKCVNGYKDLKQFNKHLFFKDANIDTGFRGFGHDSHYPVFTTKEKCMEWLKK